MFEDLRDQLAAKGHHTVLNSAFKEQKDLIEDPCRWKAALCTRRSGKSYGAGIYLLLTALMYPGTDSLYLTLDRDTAKNTMFYRIMIPLRQEHHLEESSPINWNDLVINFDNGSRIRFKGIEATENISNTLYGGKYKLVVIDECASFSRDLYDIIERKLRPALIDLEGSVLMIGTPDNVNDNNYFYQVTRPDIENRPDEMKAHLNQWNVYRWRGSDNPHMKDQFLRDIALQKAANPLVEETPAFRQMWMGEWTTGTNTQVYAYEQALRAGNTVHYGTPGNDPIKDLPADDTYKYIATVDFGFDDHSAIVIGAIGKHTKALYIVDCFKQQELDATEFAHVILEYKNKYNLKYIYGDFSDKQMVMDINNRFKLGMTPAKKDGKRLAISYMNGAFHCNEILIHADTITTKNVPGPRRKPFGEDPIDNAPPPAFKGTAPLIKELMELPWDHKAILQHNTWKEHPAFDNHLTDCLLYLFREARYFRPKARDTEGPKPGTSEYYAELLHKKIKKESSTYQPWYMKIK